MNADTGELLDNASYLDFIKKFGEEKAKKTLIPIHETEMNEKQKQSMQVSRHDNKSVLGKKFTKARKFKRGKFGRM